MEYQPLFPRKWRRSLVFLLSILFFALFLLFFLDHRARRLGKDLTVAEEALAKWEEHPDKEEGSFLTLIRFLESHPRLAQSYQAIIGQTLLLTRQTDKALPYCQHALERVPPSHYRHFAQTSLAIAQKKWQQALEEACSLKEALLQDTSFWQDAQGGNRFGSALFAFNLLRIALLEQQLGNREGERVAWAELKKFSSWDGGEDLPKPVIAKSGFVLLSSTFRVGQLSLLDYIKMREKELTPR